MKKFKVLPLGFDPMVASGPCLADCEEYQKWSPEDTESHRNLEILATIVEAPDKEALYKRYPNRWILEVE